MQYTEAARKSGKLYSNTLYCIAEKEAWRVEFGLQYTGVYCNRGGWVGLELYCNIVIVLQARRLGWLVVSQYSNGVLWLGKGLLGESRYKICIVTEAASLAGRAGWAQAGARALGGTAQGYAGRSGRARQRRWGAARGEEAGARGSRRTDSRSARGSRRTDALSARSNRRTGARGTGAGRATWACC